MYFRVGALRSRDFVNSTLYTAILAGLALVLVAMFVFGCYWLVTKDRPTPAKTPAPSSPSPSSTVIDEHDEREALAPYPNHALDALRNPFQYRQATRYPVDRRSHRPSVMNLFSKPPHPHRKLVARRHPPTISPTRRKARRKQPRPQQVHIAASIAAQRVLKHSMSVARPAVR